MEKLIEIEGMSCSNCAENVKNSLFGLPETENVKVNLEEKNATVTFSDDVDNAIIISIIKSAGYSVKNIKNI